MSNVCILGLGYIGLPTSAIAASRGHNVTGVDINPSVVEKVNAGKVHIVEPGLEEAVAKAVSAGNLKASTTPVAADIFLLIVPTPFIEENKAPDMQYVRKAAASLAPILEEGNLVILESTSPVGSVRNDVMAVIYTERPELEGKINFAFCPERAIPGDTMRELQENDRVVGGVNQESTEKAVAFYKTFVKGELLATTADTAELVKLVENSFRDVNIAFANELSLVCDHLGVSVWETIKLANHHPRVNILQPGPGVGGHCIAVDPWFIVSSAPEQAKLIRTAREVNDSKPEWVVDRIKNAMEKSGKSNPTVAMLGLAFKPDVDDLRESPSIKILEALNNEVKQGLDANIVVCEPYVESYKNYQLENLENSLEKADIVVMLTDHDEFKSMPLDKLSGKQIIDTRGTFEG